MRDWKCAVSGGRITVVDNFAQILSVPRNSRRDTVTGARQTRSGWPLRQFWAAVVIMSRVVSGLRCELTYSIGGLLQAETHGGIKDFVKANAHRQRGFCSSTPSLGQESYPSNEPQVLPHGGPAALGSDGQHGGNHAW